MDYSSVLEMPTDMRLNYIKYVSDQYSKKKKKTENLQKDVSQMKEKAEKMNVDRNQTEMPFDNMGKNG